MKDLKKEIQMLERLEHNNIVAFYFHEETAHTLSMFMEYVPGVSSISLFRTTGNSVNDIPIAYAWVFCFHVVQGPRKWPWRQSAR